MHFIDIFQHIAKLVCLQILQYVKDNLNLLILVDTIEFPFGCLIDKLGS
jgi:hypothetical protein